MDTRYLPGNITPELIQALISDYPECIADSLGELEEVRVVSLPESLTARRSEGEAYLTIDELAELVKLKL